MPTIPVKTTKLNLVTGEAEELTTLMHLMKPHPEACQVCGRYPAHEEDEPHDANSLYYRLAFHGMTGQWPTWKDAVSHCSEQTKKDWERELRAMGAWTE